MVVVGGDRDEEARELVRVSREALVKRGEVRPFAPVLSAGEIPRRRVHRREGEERGEVALVEIGRFYLDRGRAEGVPRGLGLGEAGGADLEAVGGAGELDEATVPRLDQRLEIFGVTTGRAARRGPNVEV